MRIYDVISIAYLKPAITNNSYNRRRDSPPAVIVDNEKEYQVKRLIRKRRVRRDRD